MSLSKGRTRSYWKLVVSMENCGMVSLFLPSFLLPSIGDFLLLIRCFDSCSARDVARFRFGEGYLVGERGGEGFAKQKRVEFAR